MANIRENRAIRLYTRECYSGESSPENIHYLPSQRVSRREHAYLSRRVSSYVTRCIELGLSSSTPRIRKNVTWLDNELRSLR